MERTVFIGDSVTDCDRLDYPPYGTGWVRDIVASERLAGETVNMGTSGHRLIDLAARWERDVIAQEPTRVSVAIGINDTWRRYDADDPTSLESFESGYRTLLRRTVEATSASLVLCEPFLLPVESAMRTWREDLDPKIDAVRRLATEFGAILVPFDEHLHALCRDMPMSALAEDGIHPTPLGHQRLAELWLQRVCG